VYNSIAKKIGTALSESFSVSTDVALTFPSDPLHGDLTTNVCMQVSKTVGRSPREVAQVLVRALEGIEDIEKVEVADPGFLNITLTIAARLKQLLRVQAACAPQPTRDEAPVIIEYSQPNIAKPLGLHHIIGTVLGQSVVNLYRHQGYKVVAWNYIGDWGTQFGKLAVAYRKWGKHKSVSEYTLNELLDLYVRFHDEAEKDATLVDEGRASFQKLEAGDQELRTFWKEVVEVTMGGIEEIYDRLHVSFDVTRGESPYEDLMKEIIAEGKKKGVFEEGREGALVVHFPEESNLTTSMIVKGDGATLYSTRDLAQMQYRIDIYAPQAILIFTDIAQKLHFRQLIATCGKLGWKLPAFENVLFGRMSFPDTSMSTRKGNIIQLEKALDEAVKRADRLIEEKESEIKGEEREDLAEMVGVGAFVYGILNQNRKQNMTFTWEKALTFEGNSGPYLQYTYARAKSVLRKAGMNQQSVISNQKFLPENLQIPTLEHHELLLMRHMAKFPQVLEEARADAMPHKLAGYLFSLCQAYNAFYNALPILQADEPQRSLRLALSTLTADILKTGAGLLTLRVPDRM
jgi:arginyl-tRNA synthetase